jgi:acyl carrier protein
MENKVKELIAANCGLPISAITDQAILTKDLGLDSLDTVDLVLQMEDIFHISIPDEDYPKLATVGHINQYITEKLNAKV